MNVCPECGNEIEDGKVYCDKCGYEVKFVPDFEPIEIVIDNNINGLLEGIDFEELSNEQEIENAKTKDLSEQENPTEPPKDTEVTLDKEESQSEKKKHYLHVLLAVLMFIVLVILAGLGYYYYTGSDDYILKKAEKYERNQEYDKANECYRTVLAHSPENELFELKIASNNLELGRVEEADSILLGLISKSNNENAYEMLLSAYVARKDYAALSQLLRQCDIVSIKNRYQDYVANPPLFDVDSGSYPGPLEVKLINDLPGYIYYTLDGTEPNTESIEYKNFIELNPGKHVVRAIFVNERGITSESVSAIYDVQDLLPAEPVILPESGEYTKAVYITTEEVEGCEIHYTSNGSVPDDTSARYEGPLLMPQGKSTYKFVAIDEAGRRSNISTATYELSIKTGFEEAQALNYIITILTASGRLADIDGSSVDGKHRYECIGIMSSEGADYYMVSETLAESGEIINTYGVDAMNGTVYNAHRNDEGYYVLTAF